MKTSLIFISLVLLNLGWIKGQNTREIKTGPGPEDMVIVPKNDGQAILISCTDRRTKSKRGFGEIQEYDPISKELRTLKRLNHPDSIVFQPHGIYYARLGGKDYLYVISHDEAKDIHPVLRYEYDGEALEFDRVYTSPLITSPNCLVVLDDGGFYLANDRKKYGSFWGLFLKKGNIVRFDPDVGYTIQAEKLGMAAGINIYGNTLYVSCANENKVYAFETSKIALSNKQKVAKFKGADNIRLDGNRILVTGHAKPFRFGRHARNANVKSPWHVLAIYPNDPSQTKIIFEDNGHKMSGGSTALWINSQLFVSQVFEPFILEITP